MGVQDTYSERLAPNTPGTRAGHGRGATGICETASPGIPFGRAVSTGTLSDQGVILGGTAAKFRGIAEKRVTLGAEVDAYLPPSNVDYIEEGEVWVEPGHAVAVHDPVYFVGASGVLTNQSSGNQLVKGAYWKTSCGTGGRAVVYLPDYKTPAGS
jgi:hypothetical protein